MTDVDNSNENSSGIIYVQCTLMWSLLGRALWAESITSHGGSRANRPDLEHRVHLVISLVVLYLISLETYQI